MMKTMTVALGVMAGLLVAGPAPAADPQCPSPAYHFSATAPQINLRHIFCGEVNNKGKNVGFHSTQALGQIGVPTLVAGTLHTVNAPDIFTATSQFPNGGNKFSTFFPNDCSQDQIVESILYAVGHAEPYHPWGQVGPSAPAGGAVVGHCLNGGAPFRIRFAEKDGQINTAFPE